MDTATAAIIGGSIAAALLVIKAMEIIWPGKAGGGSSDSNVIRLLEKINDRQIGDAHQLHHLAELAARHEMSLQALHRRFDSSTKT